MSPVGFVWRNLHRRPTRTYLTLLSVVIAFLLFGMLRMLAVWFALGGSDIAGANRLVVTAKYSIIEDLPLSQQRQIAAVDGVDAVTHQSWFGGIYIDSRNFFPKFPVEPRAYFDMYREFTLAPESLDAFERTRTGAVAPAALATRFGWEVGDKIPIEADIWPMRDGNRLWTFDLVGVYTVADEFAGQPPFLFHYDYFAEATGVLGSAGWYTARISDPQRAGEIAKEIDQLFENSPNPTKTAGEDELARAFAAQVGNIGLMANSILSAVFFTILLLTAVVMHWAFRERICEFGVLKTLGFSDSRVALFVLGESVLLCCLGGVIGLALALLSFQLDLFADTQFGGVTLHWPTVWWGVGIAALLGLVVGVAPAWSTRRLTIADALRRS